jgi:hypothetical protein
VLSDDFEDSLKKTIDSHMAMTARMREANDAMTEIKSAMLIVGSVNKHI